ncbi:helix-turn-helix domain-containing protein [Streptomyces sp. NPDC057757]|uniref:helix-turn-helix domain-containing protein n=1 Tax=Streptomyces sp. NPDC057757 TaxID=3346241 RepID=UPI003674C06D
MTQSPATPLPSPKERRRLREAKSLSQADVAARVGVSRETVRSWETGRTTPRGRKRAAYLRVLAAPEPEDTTASGGEAGTHPEVGAATCTGADMEPRTEAAAEVVVEAEAVVEAAAEAEVTARQEPHPEPETAAGAKPGAGGEDGTGGAGKGGGEGDGGGAGEGEGNKEPEGAGEGDGQGGGEGQGESEGVGAAQDVGAGQAVGAAQDGDAGQGDDEGAAPPAPAPALTPPQAFDALYAFCTPALVRQAYLLTGRRELARESVERAFQLAWHRWPEVAVDRDPAGWVRATAYEYALSPWHRLRPRHRHPEAPPADAADRALLDVLLKLPPMYRRTLLLYDGVGLDLPETAAETEASTPAAANRLLHAREAVAARLPELAEPDELNRRLTTLAATERLRAAKPRAVRYGSEHRARTWTRAAIAFTVLLIGATSLTLRTAPDHYEPPMAPGETVRGLPPRTAPGPLSDEQLELHAFLKSQTASGPERLVPEAR